MSTSEAARTRPAAATRERLLDVSERLFAERGIEAAVRSDPALAQGANVWRGDLVCEGVAESLGLAHTPLSLG